jgi:hypothetical protein
MDQADCTHITVIAHSLGSTIAYDTLSRYGRLLRAEQMNNDGQALAVKLAKIKRLITVGCPVDKVFFFFESQSIKLKELNKLIESQRGDIGSEPFTFEYYQQSPVRQKHRIQWLNLFDEGDPISGPVYSANPERSLAAFVRNVQISSFRLPSPGSHGAYFDHQEVLRVFYDAIFLDQTNVQNVPFQMLELNPGSSARANLTYGALLLVPVFSLLTFVYPWSPWLGFTFGWSATILLAVVVVASILSGRKHLHPIRK